MFQLKTDEIQAIANYLSNSLTISQTQIAEQIIKLITANPVEEKEEE